MALLRILLGFALVVFLPFVIGAGVSVLNTRAFMERAATAVGTYGGPSPQGLTDEDLELARVCFKLPNGRHECADVEEGIFGWVTPERVVGSPVEIAYAPDKPDDVRITGFSNLYAFPIELLFAGFVIAGIAALMGYVVALHS